MFKPQQDGQSLAKVGGILIGLQAALQLLIEDTDPGRPAGARCSVTRGDLNSDTKTISFTYTWETDRAQD